MLNMHRYICMPYKSAIYMHAYCLRVRKYIDYIAQLHIHINIKVYKYKKHIVVVQEKKTGKKRNKSKNFEIK